MCTINSNNKNSKVCYDTPKKSGLTWPQIPDNTRTRPQETSDGVESFLTLRPWTGNLSVDQTVHGLLTHFSQILFGPKWPFFRNRRSSATWLSSWFCFWLCDHGWTDGYYCWTMLADRDYQTVSFIKCNTFECNTLLRKRNSKKHFHF